MTDEGTAISLWEVNVNKDDLEDVDDEVDDVVFYESASTCMQVRDDPLQPRLARPTGLQ